MLDRTAKTQVKFSGRADMQVRLDEIDAKVYTRRKIGALAIRASGKALKKSPLERYFNMPQKGYHLTDTYYHYPLPGHNHLKFSSSNRSSHYLSMKVV